MDADNLPIKPEAAHKLLERVDGAYSLLKTSLFEDWADLDNAYRNGAVEQGAEKRGIGLIFATIQARKPYLYHQDPEIDASPRRHTETGEQERVAKVASAGLEYQFTDGDFGGVLDLVVDDEEIFGGGVVQLIFQEAQISIPIEDYENIVDDADLSEEEESDPRAQTVLEKLEELGLAPDGPDAVVRLLRVSPRNWIFPTGYTEIRQMPWVAVRRLMHIDDAQAEYGSKASHLTADLKKSEDEIDDQRPSRGYHKSDAEHVELFEVWHHEWKTRTVLEGKRTRRKKVRELHVTTLCRQPSKGSKGPTVLKNRLSPFDMDGYPFVDFRLNRAPDRYYGPSTAALMLPVAQNLQSLVDGAIDGLEATLAEKVLFNPDTIGKEGRRQLESKSPSLVAVRDRRGVGNAVKKLERTAFPQEVYGVSNLLRTFLSEVSGADESMRGGKSSAGSATEVAYRASIAEGRSNSDTRKFEKFVSRIARKTFQIMQQYFDAPRWVRVSGSDMPVSFNRHDIAGQFDVAVRTGSMRPRGPEAEREAILGFATYLAQTIQALTAAGVPPADLQPIIDKMLDLWNIQSPSMRDAFAQAVNAGMGSAGQAMQQTSPDGVAVNPATGDTLNAPTANPMVTGAAQAGTPPSQGQ